LAAILGEKASGLSATNIVRLKVGWEADYKAWSQRDLSQKRYVYWWADGVYFNVRLDEERTCVLVLIGATEDGTNFAQDPADFVVYIFTATNVPVSKSQRNS
jgi:transposase-like protein